MTSRMLPLVLVVFPFLFLPSMVLALCQGQVVDLGSGQPINGAIVTCGDTVLQTAADGRFACTNGTAQILVRAPGYQRFTVPAVDGARVALQAFAPKALYLSFYGIGEPLIRNPALDLIDRTELNALVIDVKGDRGLVPYPSQVPLAGEIGANRIRTVRHPEKLLADLKKRGVYTIARIVTFKDNLLAEAHPEWGIKDAEGNLWRDREGLAWVDPFIPEVWEYNAALAEEAARLGFDEVQFDYVRFPDQQGAVFSMESTEESRVHAITSFLWLARERLKPYNVFLAADIFGYVCWNKNDTYIGQRLEDMARYVDYLSPMLYPSGFRFGVGAYRNPVDNPFQVVYLTLEEARQRADLDARRFRPWLQAFRDYAFDRRAFGAAAVAAQTGASEEFGSSGWMLWNPRNVYRGLGLEVQPYEARLSSGGTKELADDGAGS